jgi:cob(I)alamin adenosyltransferase
MKKPDKNDVLTAKKAFNTILNVIKADKFDLIIIDEINCAIKLKLIKLKDVLKGITEKPKNVEIILTGRDAPKEIIKIADLVTEMKEIKHYFNKGIVARIGIEK